MNQNEYRERWEEQCRESAKIAHDLYPDRSPKDGRRVVGSKRRHDQRYEQWMKDMGRRPE